MSPPDRADVRQLLAQREWLARLARRLLGDGPDADDLTHETLTRALETGAPRDKTRGWLAAVAQNLFLERRRTEARRRAREEDRARPEADDDAEALDRTALRRELLDQVLKLDEPERTAVVLRYLEGLSYEDVAARQGVSVVAVRKRVSRAIERLRDRLDERPGGRDNWAGLLAPVVGIERVVGPGAGTVAASLPLASGVLAMSSTLKLVLGCGVFAALLVLVNALFDPLESESPSPDGGDPVHAGTPIVDLDTPIAEPEERERALPEETAEVETPVIAAQPAFPPRAESTVGTLELRVRWADGTAAGGVNARIMPWGADDAFKHARTIRTDERGIGVVDQLAPGTVGIYLDRCGGGQVDIVAGRLSIHEVDVPAGTTVRGRVLDPRGRPVGGATICLSAHGNRSKGFEVGESRVDGHYEVRGVNNQRYLSARSTRYAPSDQIYAAGGEGLEIEIDLHLRGEGGSLEGIVLSPEGLPLVGARVLVTERPPTGWVAPDDGRRRAEEPLPFALRTDELGRFRVDELGAGSVRVDARAEMWMPWSGTVQVGVGEPAEVEIQLVEGATLEGVVRHADGSPAAGAYVSYGGYADFDAYRVLAATDGSYRIVGLPSGLIDITASDRERGKVTAQVALTQGVTSRWDATLVEGNTAQGYVVDERGAPLAKWMVGVTDGRGLWSSRATTDAEGRFSLSNLKPNATTLTVGPPDGFQTGPSLFVHGALPTEGDVRIEVPDDVMPTASAALRVFLNDDPAPGGTQVIVRSRSPFSYREFHPDDDGRVAIPRLRPGEYTVDVSLPDYADRRLNFRVESDEELDLGDVHLTPGGRVRLVLTGEGADGFLQAKVLDESGAMASFFDVEGGSGVSSLLPAGDVRLRIESGSVAVQVIEGTVLEGETVELQASLRPGTFRSVLLRTADESPFPSASALLVFDAAGELVLHLEGFGYGSGDSASTRLIIAGLELGTYRLVLQGSDGRTAEADVSVTTMERIEGDAATMVLE